MALRVLSCENKLLGSSMVGYTHYYCYYCCFFIFSWQFTKLCIYTVKTAQYWLNLSQLSNYKVKNNWEKYTNKLINMKMNVKTTPTSQS